MIAAILFNTGDARFNSDHDTQIRDLIFGSGILQEANLPIRIAAGELPTFRNGGYPDAYTEAAEHAIFGHSQFIGPPLEDFRAACHSATIWCWVVRDATKPLAEKLDKFLRSDSAYLGIVEVNFGVSSHVEYFHEALPNYCRINGRHCTLIHMGPESDCEGDQAEADEVLSLGFEHVDWLDEWTGWSPGIEARTDTNGSSQSSVSLT